MKSWSVPEVIFQSKVLTTATLVAMSVAALPALAEDASDPRVELGLVEARRWCTDQNSGLLVGPAAIIHVDITGDGVDDLIIDERGVACDNPEVDPRVQGSAGHRIVFVIGDNAFRYVARDWFIVEGANRLYTERLFGEPAPSEAHFQIPIILLDSSGNGCGGAGYEGCMKALYWQADQERFNESAMSALEDTWSATDP